MCVPLCAGATETTPTQAIDRYFEAVSHKNIDAVLSVFDEDAVISTAAGEYRGRDAIAGFYQKGIFQCGRFRPNPGPRYLWENHIAVEVGLDCDGKIKKVGDFFTVENGKITKLSVYSGPGYVPPKITRK
jgi:hypothetical protein